MGLLNLLSCGAYGKFQKQKRNAKLISIRKQLTETFPNTFPYCHDHLSRELESMRLLQLLSFAENKQLEINYILRKYGILQRRKALEENIMSRKQARKRLVGDFSQMSNQKQFKQVQKVQIKRRPKKKTQNESSSS